jgi:Na+-transporting NADH:ubiquinone oxidoreductase subunit E
MSNAPILVVFFAAAFTDNILLTRFLGLCPFAGVSREVKTAFGLGMAVVCVMTATSFLNNIVYYGLLVPFGLTHLRFIAFIVVIAAFVQLVEMVIERSSPVLYYTLGIFLPLITVNCAILGTSLFMLTLEYGLWQSVAFGAGSGLGWALAILAMAGIREKLQEDRIPAPLRGPALTFVITGIMALAFTAFSGMVRMN